MKAINEAISGGKLRSPLETALASAGFRSAGEGVHRCDGVDLRLHSDGWMSLWRRESHDGQSLRGHLGRAGMWKAIEQNGGLRRVCDLPVRSDTAPEAVASTLTWAVETSRGDFDMRSWKAPAGHEISEAMGRGKLEVQIKDQVRRGAVVVDDNRLALRMPLLTVISDDLSEARRTRLERLLNQAQAKWRMVRIGMDGGGDAMVSAEVDLTGCPHDMLCGGGLLKTARDCLVACANWIVYPATVVADSAVGSVLLDGPPGVFHTHFKEPFYERAG